MQGMIMGLNSFKSKNGNNVSYVSMCYDYSEKEKEKGAIGQKCREFYLANELAKEVDKSYVGEVVDFSVMFVGNSDVCYRLQKLK